jgi:hypothetical protein
MSVLTLPRPGPPSWLAAQGSHRSTAAFRRRPACPEHRRAQATDRCIRVRPVGPDAVDVSVDTSELGWSGDVVLTTNVPLDESITVPVHAHGRLLIGWRLRRHPQATAG